MIVIGLDDFDELEIAKLPPNSFKHVDNIEVSGKFINNIIFNDDYRLFQFDWTGNCQFYTIIFIIFLTWKQHVHCSRTSYCAKYAFHQHFMNVDLENLVNLYTIPNTFINATTAIFTQLQTMEWCQILILFHT